MRCIQCIKTLLLIHQNQQSEFLLKFLPKGGTLLIKGGQSHPKQVYSDLVHPTDETKTFLNSLDKMLFKNSLYNTLALIWSIQPMPNGDMVILETFLAHYKQTCFSGCAQTLPDATPPIGKIQPFSKMAITLKPIMQFLCPLRFVIS